MKGITREDIHKIDFEKQNGLAPIIVQDAENEQVLMLGYANAEALTKTIDTGFVWFFSRSKNRLWQKGESSGNVLKVSNIYLDCDLDTVLIKAYPKGPTCHTGSQSCFNTKANSKLFIRELDQLIQERKSNPPIGSYTTSLFESGINRISQKVGEEATETIIAALNQSDEDFLNEAADLIYHLNVLLVEKGYNLQTVDTVLKERHKKSD
jgi:phosphoribosyl-ATP pyrophosphohydrolase/phosphoribosyl-AMP cyclohydrolase